MAAGGLVGGLAGGAAPAEAQSQPNVVLFYVDDMGWADWQADAVFNPTGSNVYETPNMLRLASLGTTFTQGYAASGVCSPSRAGLLTGQSAAQTGITDFIGAGSGSTGTLVRTNPGWTQNIPASQVLIPEAMRSAGYHTGFFGKWHMGQGGTAAADPLQNGFDVNVAGTNSGNPGFAGGFFAGADGAWAGMPGLDTPGTYAADTYLSDAIAAQATGYIGDRVAADEPFFLMNSMYLVHTPIEAPADLVTKYEDKLDTLTPAQIAGQDNATYAAMVEKMDQALGLMLNRLEDPNNDGDTSDSVLGETIIAFTSDNGGLLNGNVTDNRPLRSGKGSLYEGGIREPFIVANTGGAGMLQGVVNSDDAVIGYDLYPTLLELTGAAGDAGQNATFEGQSFAAALRGESYEAKDLFWHYPHVSPQSASAAVDGGRWVSAVRRGDLKLMYFYDTREFELYDLSTDLGETNNLMGSNPMLAAAMSRALYGQLRDVGATLPISIASNRALPSSAIVAPVLVDTADAVFTDTFNAGHSFLAGSVAGTEWDGVMNAGNATVFDANQSNAGALTLQNASNTRILAGSFSAPFLYESITGDFEAVMAIGSMTSADFHVMAIVAADPDAADQDFVWLGQQNRGGAVDFAQSRSIDDGVRVDNVQDPGLYSYYRLVREGDSLIGFVSADGVVWVPYVEYDRGDLPDTLLVGLSQASFGGNTVTAEIDSFQIIVPEPGSVVILIGGSLLLLRRRAAV